jgi:hypothetical protein
MQKLLIVRNKTNQHQVPALNAPEYSFLTHDAPWTPFIKVMMSIPPSHCLTANILIVEIALSITFSLDVWSVINSLDFDQINGR